MAVVDIRDENLSREREELDTLRRTLEQRINSIDNQLSTLKECWQDENSTKWLADQNNLMTELKSQNQKATAATDEYFNEVIETLRVYAK